MRKEVLGVIGSSPSPLYRRTYKAVQDIDQKLSNLIHKWHLLKTGLPMRVEKFDGSMISYQGLAFSGSPVEVFWRGFIEPYLENYSIQVLEQTSTLAIECQFSVEESVEEAKLLLLTMVRRTYTEMAETDRILRGDGINFPAKRDVSGKIESMSELISQHAEIEKYKKPTSKNQIFNIEKLTGHNVQLGNNNIITTSLNLFFESINSSGDREAIIALENLLKNSTVSEILNQSNQPM